MDKYLTAEQVEADNAQYAALAAELAEPDADIPSSEPTSRDAPDDTRTDVQPPDEDAERQQRIADAALQANQWMQQLAERDLSRSEPPSVQDDPLGYVQHLGQQLQSVVAQNQQRQFAQAVQASEELIRQSTPDYDSACQHLEAIRMAQLEMLYGDDNPQAHVLARHLLGPNATPADLRTANLNQDRVQLAQMALSRGQSPAQLYYDLAVKSGFRSSSQALEATQRGLRASSNHAKPESARRGRGVPSEKKLLEIYADGDHDAFDKEWERYAKAHR